MTRCIDCIMLGKRITRDAVGIDTMAYYCNAFDAYVHPGETCLCFRMPFLNKQAVDRNVRNLVLDMLCCIRDLSEVNGDYGQEKYREFERRAESLGIEV